MLKAPVVVAYGGGTNSTAMLIELARRQSPVNLILFADTGGEKPETYRYVKTFSAWCQAHGLPAILKIHRTNFRGIFETLEQMCLRLKVLPAIAYGWKTCSLKYKKEPQDKYLNHWPPARTAWNRGQQVIKLIGYDADEPQRAKPFSDDKYLVKYPLIEWGWGRAECLAAIDRVGLARPGKSACFFCPSSTKIEIIQIKKNPILWRRALRLERVAAAGEHAGGSTRGLGRSLTWPEKIKQGKSCEIEKPCDCYDEASE